jgi:hypothetical protein
MNMLNPFRIIALPMDRFDSLFRLDDESLEAHGARRLVVDKKPGYPCRVSLIDAEPGETVLLIPFTHHDVDSPYRGSGPIFVRANARMAEPVSNEIPAMFRARPQSIRAYDEGAMMVGSDVVSGSELEERISRFFDDERVKYLHLHNARPGCFNCRVERA